MANRSIIVFTTMAIITFGFILTLPITFISVGLSSYLSSYGVINENFSYEYIPNTPSSIEKLGLDVDIGDIEIRYIDPPVNYFVKIDVFLDMAGFRLAGKKYSEYFNIITGDLTSSPIGFSMKCLSDINDPIMDSLINNISIMVTLRKDIKFDISTTTISGNVNLSVPFNVHINNIKANTTNGDILFDLKNCIVEGCITGIGYLSDIELKTYNVQYTQNSLLNLTNYFGDIKFDIYQSKEMGANITGFGVSTDGMTHIIFNDYTETVGAWFKLINYTSWEYHENTYNEEGFFYDNTLDSGHEFISSDFPAKYNYNISLLTQNGWRGAWRWNLYNEPS